jgi:protein O-mannosyl-transferase
LAQVATPSIPEYKNYNLYFTQSNKTQMKREYYLLICLLILVAIVMSPVLRNQFVNWDDHLYLLNNEVIKKTPFSNLGELFTYKINNFAVPLTLLSFQIEYYFFEFNPKPYHFNNLVLHLLNVMLVYFFFKQLLITNYKLLITTNLKQEKTNKEQEKTNKEQETKNYKPFLIALLFGIHPMNVESVAWVTERKDLLYAFFTLLSLLFYVKINDQEQQSQRRTATNNKPETRNKEQQTTNYVFCLLFFLSSLLSKPQAIFFPFLLLLVDYFRSDERTFWQIFNPKKHLNKIPFFAISLLTGIYLLQNIGTKVDPNDIDYSLLDKLLFSYYQVSIYLSKLFFPFYLNNFYSYPKNIDGFYPIHFYILPFVITGLFGFLFWKFRKNQLVVFGLLFYFVNIFIFLQVFNVNTSIAYERFNYLGYLGLFFILVHYFSQIRIDYARLLLGSYLLLFSILSYQRCKIWANDHTLFEDMAKKNPNDNRAVKLAKRNRADALLAENKVMEAIQLFSEAIQIDPNYGDAYVGRAYAYMQVKQFAQSVADYNKAISLGPKPEGLRSVLFNRAVCFTELKQYQAAIQDYNTILQQDPANTASYLNRAFNWIALGDYAKAQADYQTVLRMDATNAVANQQLRYLQSLKK